MESLLSGTQAWGPSTPGTLIGQGPEAVVPGPTEGWGRLPSVRQALPWRQVLQEGAGQPKVRSARWGQQTAEAPGLSLSGGQYHCERADSFGMPRTLCSSLPMGGRGLGGHRQPSDRHHPPALNAFLTKHRSGDSWLPELRQDGHRAARAWQVTARDREGSVRPGEQSWT